MSLYKQLWLSIVCLMALTFAATVLVTSLTTRHYLEHQLYMDNVDAASAFAMQLDQQGNDLATKEALLETGFQSGHYEMIELSAAGGRVLQRWQESGSKTEVPQWFMRLLSIDVPAGVAQLKADGEIITVRGHTRLVHESLWRSSLSLTLVFLVAAIIAGALGTLLLKMILKPLDGLVRQSQAIAQRQFITSPEPAAKELKSAVRSMNKLSVRVKAMLEQESSRLDKWRQNAHTDQVTGLLNRNQFIRELDSTLKADDYNTTGVICLIRIAGLARLNQVHGRDAIDSVLAGFGATINNLQRYHKGTAAARLNGADFVLLIPREMDAALVGKDLQKAMREMLAERGLGDEVHLPAASTIYLPGDSPTDLLTNLDSALLNSEMRSDSELVTMGRDGIQMMPVRQELKRWRSMLSLAFGERRFSLAAFPVLTLTGELVHHEAPVRLQWKERKLSAGQFLPWIHRLELAGELDRQVIELAIDTINRERSSLGINVSGAALTDADFLPWLSQKLSSHPEAAALLWLEVGESTAYRHLEQFKRLCTRSKRYGTRIGLEHVGHQLSDIGRLHDVGVDYVKVDSAFVGDIDTNPANQTLLRTLCTLVHSLGITVIAEGVNTDEEWQALAELGFDSATGPQVTARYTQTGPASAALA